MGLQVGMSASALEDSAMRTPRCCHTWLACRPESHGLVPPSCTIILTVDQAMHSHYLTAKLTTLG